MISFSGMEFTLTFLAVERFACDHWTSQKCFWSLDSLIFIQGFFVRRFVGKIGEEKMALLGIVLGTLAFILISQSFVESVFFPLFLMSAGVTMISQHCP